MGYNNQILEPKSKLKNVLGIPVFESVRSTSIKKSSRNRECFWCGMKNIQKGERYVNHQFRYDGRIITISFHEDCFK